MEKIIPDVLLAGSMLILVLLGSLRHKYKARKRIKRLKDQEEYEAKRKAYYQLEREKVIDMFWQNYHSGLSPLDVLLQKLANGLEMNSGGSEEWRIEFAVIRNQVKQKERKRQKAYSSEHSQSQQQQSALLKSNYSITLLKNL